MTLILNQEAFAKALAAGIAAYDDAASQEDSSWIEWAGGECPVRPGVFVDVKFLRGNQLNKYEAGFWSWLHVGADDWARYGGNIIAYRLAK